MLTPHYDIGSPLKVSKNNRPNNPNNVKHGSGVTAKSRRPASALVERNSAKPSKPSKRTISKTQPGNQGRQAQDDSSHVHVNPHGKEPQYILGKAHVLAQAVSSTDDQGPVN